MSDKTKNFIKGFVIIFAIPVLLILFFSFVFITQAQVKEEKEITPKDYLAEKIKISTFKGTQEEVFNFEYLMSRLDNMLNRINEVELICQKKIK